jgi:hypothetical protein
MLEITNDLVWILDGSNRRLMRQYSCYDSIECPKMLRVFAPEPQFVLASPLNKAVI